MTALPVCSCLDLLSLSSNHIHVLAPTPAAQPVDHKIIVGDGGKLVYNPSNITASIGDTVTFEFRPKNHTVTQSSFLNPCVSLAESSGGQQVGFKSGFVPVAPDAQSPFPTFQIKINDVSTPHSSLCFTS